MCVYARVSGIKIIGIEPFTFENGAKQNKKHGLERCRSANSIVCTEVVFVRIQ